MPEVKPTHTEAEEEQLNILYAQLKPEAATMYLNYFLARTPAHLQADMKDLIENDLATPPTAPEEGATEDPPVMAGTSEAQRTWRSTGPETQVEVQEEAAEAKSDPLRPAPRPVVETPDTP